MTFRIFGLLLLFPLLASGQGTKLTVPYTRFTLPNGLTVILHEDHTTPTVSVNIYYHVGSGSEKPGRTGFAHLFEHLMFEGSANVPEGKFDQWLEAAGGENNGSTSTDRTNYWINVPRNAVELALFLESDRMAYLLNTMSEERVNGQRDVVKNERRQSYENRPYGMAFPTISANVYPPDHPYHWPTIGSMADLSAASYADVVEFFKKYYAPNNASLSIAGDIEPAAMRALVEKWFGEAPAGKPVAPVAPPSGFLGEEKRLMFEDKVSLPRLYMVWQSPRSYAPGDAELDILANILTGGKNARLYRRLVYEMQIAQDVSAFQMSSMLGSMFLVSATARPGVSLGTIEQVIQAEIDRIAAAPPSAREVERAVNQYEASFLDRLENVGGFGGKADQLNWYYVQTGNPDYFNEDLARYRAVDPQDVSAAALTTVGNRHRVVLSIVPRGKAELASTPAQEVKPQ